MSPERPYSLDPDQALERLAAIAEEAQAAIARASTTGELEELRVRYLGRKAELPQLLRAIPQLPPERRGELGRMGNETRHALETLVQQRIAAVEASELEQRLGEDRIDVTLPGDPPLPVGHLHLLTTTRREIEDIFIGMGYRVVEGPEVEVDYYNFTALNIPAGHPARNEMDTFYFSDEMLLRTHTSPMQVRSMEAQPPPIYIIVPGVVYRRDSDATHTPMFTQVEGLAVDEDITLADLQGTLLEFARATFGKRQRVRLRAGYFPFTEPSVEVDVSCFVCDARGRRNNGSLCSLCKGSGWIEIMGAGMVDPNVFGFVADNGYDPERVQGFAFGMGVERIAMLKHGVPDLRLFFENDLRFLEQF
jgi:phenylalanyl-tRNA synthetase alpha chain